MKRCPSCNRSFDDESLGFCPHDGTGLEMAASSAPVELQATMMAPPPSIGGSSFPSPPPPPAPDSGRFNPPPPSPSWAPPSASQASQLTRGGGINKKLIFGGVGCLALAVIVGVIGIGLLFAFSGPSSKMNPYKGDLKDLVPEKAGTHTRVDVDVLSEKDKKDFGKVNEALGVAYKGSSETDIRMFVGNYSSSKDAENGLKSFRDESLRKDWSASEIGLKKIGWRTVGSRCTLTKGLLTGKADDKILPDGAVIVQSQTSSSSEMKQLKFVAWTNGSVIFVVAAEGNKADEFEKLFDSALK